MRQYLSVHFTIKKIVLAACVLCMSGASYGQSLTTVAYSMGFSTGELNEFISQASFRGVVLDFQKMVQPNIGVGLTLGMNVFYDEKPYDTYTANNASLSGKQWRYSNHFPIYLSGSYFLKQDQQINPFVGLGIGTIYTLRNTDMNLYTIEQEAWNFALKPAIGFLINTGSPTTSAHVSLNYNYGFQAGSELKEAQSYLSLNVGFSFGQ